METVNLIIPTCWQELTPAQLRYAFYLLSEGYTLVELKTLALCRWSGLRIIAPQPNGYTVQYEQRTFRITAQQLAELLSRLHWLSRFPLVPVRLPEIHRHKALPADFSGVPFETYLYLENLYQGVMHFATSSNEGPLCAAAVPLLSEMTDMLYACSGIHYEREELLSVFYWYTSLKQFFARQYSHLFGAAGSEPASQDLSQRLNESMNTLIRALTKGDITKEATVLSMDVHRALTELNAQAQEYEDLKRRQKS